MQSLFVKSVLAVGRGFEPAFLPFYQRLKQTHREMLMKDTTQYKALHDAVRDFNARHSVMMGYWGDLLGFAPKNSDIMFAGKLNPNSEKAFNSTQMMMVIAGLDERGRRIYFDGYLRQWGLETVSIVRGTQESVKPSLHQLADSAMVQYGNVFHIIKEALADGVLDDGELREIDTTVAEAMISIREVSESIHAEKQRRETM